MTAYVSSPESNYGMKIWVPRRAKTKQTYPGMLDNTVAGGMATGEDSYECLVRESEEEASLPEKVVRERVKAVGQVTYMYVRNEKAGGESGLIQPECKSTYILIFPCCPWQFGPFEMRTFETDLMVLQVNTSTISNCLSM